MDLEINNSANSPSKLKSKTSAEGMRDHDSKPQNYYEDKASAKQLAESVPEFLSRLPPSTTTSVAISDHWIWICNPYPNHPRARQAEDVATFRQLGTRLLEGYLARKADVERENRGKPAGSITRLLRPDRLSLESDISDLAKTKGITNGKWMLFPRENEVDRVWEIVANAVWEGKLGNVAKVATAKAHDELAVERRGDIGGGGNAGNAGRDARDQGQRLICIYTPDFNDKDDVSRVLRSIKNLGLLKSGGFSDGTRMNGSSGTSGSAAALKTIYYKCDAYTYLDIASGNEYKLKASMYSSRDLFAEWYSRGSGGGFRERYFS